MARKLIKKRGLNQKDYPLVSIIIPTFNRAGIISKAIKSVLNQTYKNWELIIIDDGSVDNTKEVVKSYSSKYKNKIKYYYKKNGGVCSARNFGIQKANGEYISLLDSDDEYKPRRIEIQLKITRRRNALFSLSNCIVSINNIKKILKNETNHFIEKKEIVKGAIRFSASLMLFKKDILKNIDFDESLPAENDLDFILRLTSKYNILYVNNRLVIIYKTLDYERISTNPKNKILAYKIILKKIKKNIYKLKKQENELFLNNIYYSLGFFNLIDKNYKNAKYYLRKNLRSNHLFSKKYLISLITYLISYSPFICNIGLKIALNLWKKNKIGFIKM
jgi:glycosyltransferase involved in cell wall biosynthesis